MGTSRRPGITDTTPNATSGFHRAASTRTRGRWTRPPSGSGLTGMVIGNHEVGGRD
jgi:hypothetical protein